MTTKRRMGLSCRLAEILALLAVGLAALVLWSWGASVADLFTVGPQYLPMAPSTALLVVLLGWGIFGWNRWPERRDVLWACRAVAGVVGLIGLLFVLRPWMGWGSPLEVWVVRSTGLFPRSASGQMSPLSGAAFCVLGTAFLLRLRPRPRVALDWAAFLLLGGLVVLAAGAAAGYAFGRPWLYGGPLRSVALATILSLGLASVALMCVGRSAAAAAGPAEASHPGSHPVLVSLGVFVLLAGMFGCLSAYHLRCIQAAERADAHALLESVGSLKAAQLAQRSAWLGPQVVWTLSLTVVLAAGAALVARLLWKSWEAGLIRRQLAVERQRLALAQRIEHLMKRAGDAILLTDAQNNRFLEANDRALAMYGYALVELQALSPALVRAPEAREKFRAHMEELFRCEQAVYETLHQRKDGSCFPVEVSASLIDIDGVRYCLAFIRDITTRKSREKEIARLTQLYATLSALNRSLVRVRSGEELFQTACTVAAQHAGFKLAWIGRVEPQTRWVRPVARAGESLEYLDQVCVYADGPLETQCPAGRCLREQRTVICNEFASDVLIGPWQEAARAHGLQAAAALPLVVDAEVRGAFIVYASEPGVFQDKEVALLEEMALDIAYALHHLEQESKRRQAETALKASEQRYRALFEAGSDAIVLNGFTSDGLAGKFIEVNDLACQRLGYTRAELLQKTALDIDPCLPPERVRDLNERLRAQGRIVFCTEQRAKDGRRIPVEVSCRLFEWEGKPMVVSIARDLTERAAAEAALRESERRFREMMENLPLVSVILDERNRVLFCNEHLLRLTGWQREEVLGQDFMEVFIPAEQRDHLVEVANAVRTGTPVPHQENEILTRAGERRLIAWNNTSLKNVAGQIVGVASIGEDVTDRRQLEAQLRQAQKMEAIGQLAGGVAHDFNNILAATMLSLELLLMDSSLKEETQQSLKELMAHAQRAAGLTRQLLLFSRRSVMQVAALDVNEVVEQLLKMLRRLIGEHIQLEWHAKTHLPPVAADAGMLEQVVMNLVVNARDAMAQGGQLTLATHSLALGPEQARQLHPAARPGRFVCLTVTDTGCGMEDAVLKRIFEPFFTTKEAGKGTGLGLATVYGIVGQHQGWVTVESRVGQGSTFRVFLPAVEQPVAADAAGPKAPSVRGGAETILLVEDDSAVRKTTRSFLQRWGYRVLEAENGLEALGVWQAHQEQVDLLLTDMVMPAGVSGLDLAERLRATKPHLKVIISSGYSNELLQQGTAALKDIHYCPKPCPPAELAASLRRCLETPLGAQRQ